MGAKYELIKDKKETIVVRGCELYRIRALKDFSNVKKGDLGGYVNSVYNLDQAGDCWIYDDAKVFQNAKVYGNAIVCGSAEVSGNALVYDNAIVGGFARVYEHARVIGTSLVTSNVQIFKNSTVVDVAMYDNFVASGGYYDGYPVYSDTFCVTSPKEVMRSVQDDIYHSKEYQEWWQYRDGWKLERGDYGFEWKDTMDMEVPEMFDWWNYNSLFDDQINFCLKLKEVINEYLLVYKNREDVRKSFISNAMTMPAQDAASQYLKEIFIDLTGNDVDIISEECILGVDRKIEEIGKQKNKKKQQELKTQLEKNDKSKKSILQKKKMDQSTKLETQKEKIDKQEAKKHKKTENQDKNSVKKEGSLGIFESLITLVNRKRK